MVKLRRDYRIPGVGIPLDGWQALCAKYENRCLWCGEAKPLVLDHVIPVSRGGTHTIENAQPLCSECNLRKMVHLLDFRDSPFPGASWRPERRHVPIVHTRIELEDSDHARLRVAAAYAGLSMAEFVKRATLEAIKQQERKAAAAPPDED